jgi:hypothetical protein
MKVYKIRHTETGLYSSGGVYGIRWTKTGKTWSHYQHVKSHLRLVERRATSYPLLREEMNKWEVLELITEEINLGTPSKLLKS